MLIDLHRRTQWQNMLKNNIVCIILNIMRTNEREEEPIFCRPQGNAHARSTRWTGAS